MKRKEANRKTNTRNLEVLRWSLKDLLGADPNQTPPVHLLDPINHRLRIHDRQLLCIPMGILGNRILDRLRVRQREIDRRRLPPQRIRGLLDPVQNLLAREAPRDRLLNLPLRSRMEKLCKANRNHHVRCIRQSRHRVQEVLP